MSIRIQSISTGIYVYLTAIRPPSFRLLMGQYCSVTVVDLLQEEMMTCFAVDIVLPRSGKIGLIVQ